MHKHSALVPLLALLCLFLPQAPTLGAQVYEVIELGTLGGSTSYARAISDSGIAGGWATDFPGARHATLWDDQGIQDLGFPGGMAGEVVAVNDSRQAAGTGEGSPQSYRAHLWEAGTWTPLGVLPGRAESIAEDIDSGGRIVGRSFTLGQGDSRAFLWEDGNLMDLGTLGGASSGAYGINDVLQIAGTSFQILSSGSQGQRAFRWEAGVMHDLGVLDGRDYSQAFDINDQGDVVGSSWTVSIPQFLSVDRATLWRDGGAEIIDLGSTPISPSTDGIFYGDNIARAVNNCGQVVGHAQHVGSGGDLAAFLWQEGVNHNLNDLIPADSGWDLLSARDINDAGEIVGFGIGPNSDSLRGFLLRPLAPTPCGGCSQEQDCDDGLFCNGVEICRGDGICAPGSDPCPGLPCDEDTDECLPSPCDGDGVCDSGEDCRTCPEECIGGIALASCGDGVCQTGAGEDCASCPEDCNGMLTGKPDGRFCCGNGDGYLPLGCGDLRCVNESFACTEGGDGVPFCCGDGTCGGDENSANCELDCGTAFPPCLTEGSACGSDAECCSLKCSGGTCRRSRNVRQE